MCFGRNDLDRLVTISSFHRNEWCCRCVTNSAALRSPADDNSKGVTVTVWYNHAISDGAGVPQCASNTTVADGCLYKKSLDRFDEIDAAAVNLQLGEFEMNPVFLEEVVVVVSDDALVEPQLFQGANLNGPR